MSAIPLANTQLTFCYIAQVSFKNKGWCNPIAAYAKYSTEELTARWYYLFPKM